MNKLDEYLRNRKAADLARATGISPTLISLLRTGARQPSFATARKIHDATSGEVTYTDWAAS